jgi:Nucleotidyl transferase AbiEii toxin, Type IV TA system
MFGDGSLTFQEFVMREPLPLAVIHDAVLEFLKGMEDAALFGAQAVNAYVDEPRMTQDVDILSLRARELAQELRDYLNKRFHIAVRIREVVKGRGYRLFQMQKPKNRHLVDVRAVPFLPPTRRVQHLLVVSPEELVASKVIAYQQRKGQPKAFTDRRDIAVLLLRFPKLKSETGLVRDRLRDAGAEASVLATWSRIVHEKIAREREEDEF